MRPDNHHYLSLLPGSADVRWTPSIADTAHAERARPSANQVSHHALFRRVCALTERDAGEEREADGQTETDQKTLFLVQRVAKDHDRKRVSHHIPKQNERDDGKNTPGNRHVRVSRGNIKADDLQAYADGAMCGESVLFASCHRLLLMHTHPVATESAPSLEQSDTNALPSANAHKAAPYQDTISTVEMP